MHVEEDLVQETRNFTMNQRRPNARVYTDSGPRLGLFNMVAIMPAHTINTLLLRPGTIYEVFNCDNNSIGWGIYMSPDRWWVSRASNPQSIVTAIQKGDYKGIDWKKSPIRYIPQADLDAGVTLQPVRNEEQLLRVIEKGNHQPILDIFAMYATVGIAGIEQPSGPLEPTPPHFYTHRHKEQERERMAEFKQTGRIPGTHAAGPKPLSEDPLDGGGIILTESKVGIVNPPRGCKSQFDFEPFFLELDEPNLAQMQKVSTVYTCAHCQRPFSCSANHKKHEATCATLEKQRLEKAELKKKEREEAKNKKEECQRTAIIHREEAKSRLAAISKEREEAKKKKLADNQKGRDEKMRVAREKRFEAIAKRREDAQTKRDEDHRAAMERRDASARLRADMKKKREDAAKKRKEDQASNHRKRMICRFCHRVFLNQGSFAVHEEQCAHRTQNEALKSIQQHPLQCSKCGKSYINARSHQKHEAVCNGNQTKQKEHSSREISESDSSTSTEDTTTDSVLLSTEGEGLQNDSSDDESEESINSLPDRECRTIVRFWNAPTETGFTWQELEVIGRVVLTHGSSWIRVHYRMLRGNKVSGTKGGAWAKDYSQIWVQDGTIYETKELQLWVAYEDEEGYPLIHEHLDTTMDCCIFRVEEIGVEELMEEQTGKTK